MANSIELGKASAKGSSNLFFGMVISNIIMAVGAIIIGRLLGPDQYGLYALSAVLANFLSLCVSFGVYPGIIRYLAHYTHQGENENIKQIIASGLIFLGIVGSIFAISSLLLSKTMAIYLGRPNATLLIAIYSLTILTDALATISFFIFIGLEKTQYYTALQILQAILKVTISLVLVTMGFGAVGAVIGIALASFSSCVSGILIIIFPIRKKLHNHFTEAKLLANLKMMITYGFPLYIRDLVKIGTQTHLLNFLMVLYASNVLIGNYKVALNFHVLLNFIAWPISTMLFPTFSKLDIKKNRELLKDIFAASVKYTSLFIVPATVMLIVLSEPIIFTLYGEGYSQAPLFLSLSALIFLYTALGENTIVNFMSSQDETTKSMVLGFANAALALILALILIPRFQILGLIISLTISGSPTIIIGSLFMKKLYDFSIDWNRILRIFSNSFIIGITTFLVLRYLINLNPQLELVIGFLVFSFLFVVLSPLTGAINLDDIANLRNLFAKTMIIPKILRIPLELLSKSCEYADRGRKAIKKRELQ